MEHDNKVLTVILLMLFGAAAFLALLGVGFVQSGGM